MMKTHMTLKKISTAFATLMVAAACTPKEVAVSNHDSAIQTEPVVYAPKGPAADVQAFSKLDLEKLTTSLRSSGASAAIGILTQLEPYMLVSTYIEDAKFASSEKMRKILELWNRTLLGMHKVNPDEIASRGLLDKYARMVMSGCDEELKGCLNIGFFRQDANSARLIEALATRTETEIAKASDTTEKDKAVARYYRYLMVSFDLRNRVANQEFEFLYLNRARDYAEYFSRLTGQAQTKPAMQRHKEIFEMILNDFNPNMNDPAFKERVEKFVGNFSPWTFSHRASNPFGIGATKMLRLAARNFLYESDSENAPLNASLRKAIADMQKEVTVTNDKEQDAEQELTFDQMVTQLRSTNPNLFKTLSLDSSFPRDEYFFMVDRLFGNHLTPDDVTELWAGSRKNSERLLKTLEQYLKIQISWLIVRTNAHMSKVYSNKDGYSSNTLVKNAVEKSWAIAKEWQQTKVKIDRIGVFVNRHMKQAKSEQKDENFDRIEKMLTSLGRNIKYISVYPNMMMMVYFMERSDGTISIDTWFGKVDIDTLTIITAFFDGNLAPFFDFGNDGEKLKRLETLYAFFFALKTDTFKAFNADAKNPVDEVKFFEKVIGKYLAENQNDLVKEKQELADAFGRSTTHSTFLHICEQDREAIKNKILPGKTGTTLSIEFKDFPYLTYMGNENMGLGQSANRFYNDGVVNMIKEKLNKINVKLVFVKSMVKIFSDHLVNTGVDETRRKEIIGQIEKNIEKVTEAKAEFLTEILRRHAEISKCFTNSLQVEWDRQYRLMEMEENYLRTVYKAMKKERDPEFALANPSVPSLAEVQARYNLVLPGDNFPAGFKGTGMVTPDELFYTEMDVLLRLRAFMKELAPRVNIILPPDLTDTEMWKARRQSTIPGSLSEDDFVAIGLRQFNGLGTSYVKWLSTTSSLKPLDARIRMLVELMKLGELQIFDWTSKDCRTKGDITSCPKRSVRVSAEDVVNEWVELIDLVTLTVRGENRREVRLMNLMGVSRKFDVFQLEKLFLDEKTGRPLSLMEGLYKMAIDDQVALKEARDYYATDSTKGHFLFTPDDSVASTMRKSYRPLVLDAFKIATDLEAAIQARAQKDKASGRVLEVGHLVSNGRVDIIRPALGSDGTPVYLDPAKPADYEAKKKLFHEETRNHFIAKEGDEDFTKAGHK